MKVALVHDYLREYGGAERVLETLHEIYPTAPVYVSFYDKKALGEHAQRFENWDIRETKITELPFYKHLFSPYRVFAVWAFELLDLSEYDVVISSTNAYQSKAVQVRPDATHISYVHTPSRALYGFSTKTNWKKNPFVRVVGECINFWMRYVDFRTAQRPSQLLANSKTTQERIAKFWRRDSIVVPPPVSMVDRLTSEKIPAEKDRSHLLFVGRLVLSKHPELAVQISNDLDLPLQVVGTGSMLAQLKASAGPQVEFLGAVDDVALSELYQNARLVLFPAEDEDFGIVPIEAMSAGTPVIAHFSGEPRFTVSPGKSGEHVFSFAPEEWCRVVGDAWRKKWDYAKIARSVRKYSQREFSRVVQELVLKSSRVSTKG